MINAQALVVGRAGRAPDGRVVARVPALGRALGPPAGVSSASRSAQPEWRRLGHLMADQVYQRLTGEKGYFDTQVVFVDETGPKDRRNKRLAIMDQDGANVRLLSQGRRAGAHPALQPDDPGYRLHAVHRRPAARVPHEPGDRASANCSATSPA